MYLPHGIEVFLDDRLCAREEWKQFRFPKSKKKRIRKKWAKKRINYKYKTVYRTVRYGNKLFVPSVVYNKLKESLT